MQMQMDADDLLGRNLATAMALVGRSDVCILGRSLSVEDGEREVVGRSDTDGSGGKFVVMLVGVVHAHGIVDVGNVDVFLDIGLGDRSDLLREVSDMREIEMRDVMV